MKPLRGHGQSILVIDDNEQQRQIALKIHAHLGYQVKVTKKGEQAILLCQDTPFDLILLDMLMHPGIDSLETYQRICNFQPGQKAIIVNGFSQLERAKEALSLRALQYVQKPYTLLKISEMVHAALFG